MLAAEMVDADRRELLRAEGLDAALKTLRANIVLYV
jgi:hypothetical protein